MPHLSQWIIGDGFAPVPLTAEHPVAQLIIHLALAEALLHQIVNDGLLGLGHLHTVQEAAVDHYAVLNVSIGFLLNVAAGHDLHHGQAELMGKLPVTGVVGGHRHDRAGAVGHQDVVGQPDRDLLAVHRVNGANAFDLHAGLFLVQLRTLEVALAGRLLTISHARVVIGDLILQLFDQRMFGRQHHVSRAEQRIGAGGVNAHFLTGHSQSEIHLSALASPADPVALLHLHLVDEVHFVQAVQQFLGIGGDAQHPLGL